MYIPIFLQSLLIGFSIAAPVGPIGILCIRRTLAEGRRAGFVSGLGAATADAIYGVIAAFGLTYVSSFFINQSNWLRLGGGLFLIFLGVKTFLSSPRENNIHKSNQVDQRGMLNNYLSTFFLTISNPLTILSFTAIFAGFGASLRSLNYLAASLMVLGIFFGSVFWWFLLSYLTSLFQNRINFSALIWINRIAGTIIFIFGVVALLSLITLPTL